MKCDSCGYNLNIEDNFCPHCGSKNIYAAKHSMDMENYSRQFEETKEEVIANSRKINEFNVRITVIAVLIAIISVIIIMIFKADDIAYNRKQKAIKRNENMYIEQIKAFEDKRDIDGLYAYMDSNQISYVSQGKLRNYSTVYLASYYYLGIEEQLRTLSNRDRDVRYNTDEYCVKRIVDQIGYISPYFEEDNYNKELLTEERGEYVFYVKGLIEDTIKVYCNLTDEQARGIWTMNPSRLGIMIEEGVLYEQTEE